LLEWLLLLLLLVLFHRQDRAGGAQTCATLCAQYGIACEDVICLLCERGEVNLHHVGVGISAEDLAALSACSSFTVLMLLMLPLQ